MQKYPINLRIKESSDEWSAPVIYVSLIQTFIRSSISLHEIFSICRMRIAATVGSGISPDPALRLAGYTAGRELHPAPKHLFSLWH